MICKVFTLWFLKPSIRNYSNLLIMLRTALYCEMLVIVLFGLILFITGQPLVHLIPAISVCGCKLTIIRH